MKRTRPARGSDDEVHLMVRCAELYYYGQRTQAEVALELGITRLRVNQLLRRARDEGIVRIAVVDPRRTTADVATALATRFGLREAVVVRSSAMDANAVAIDLARAAAEWLRGRLSGPSVVGIGWGQAVATTVRHLAVNPQPSRHAEAWAVPLLGALGDSRPEFRSNDLARDFAAAFLGQWQPLDLPFLVERPEVREALLRDRVMQPVMALWERLDLAIVGIGYSIARSPLLRTPYFDKSDIMEMERLGIVGDVLSRFFDAQGAVPPLPFYSRLIGIDLSLLRRGPVVVGIAGGLEKTASILGALRGRHVDVLVTDERTARAILEEPGVLPATSPNRPAGTSAVDGR
ncbi:MAG: sugar-binding transcriptional regulator [Limnochordaceae bacterium]|uniref:Sugar-binding transcriptional regulator n=1 Tax=Carboxydichorda subterranea TaxID=3109565 RepID=A0ABZ1C1F0_9FIRM|nr:sugar-binding transcriptional regulator [Limnochorda sp. L945t]MBE3597612.1 sugar-binding transcriptional regulator [Limnochordaceae bacterium]WRP18675.1 sugar-binding transcriptional regulator [Limnochorda sp. L945t]